ncbi:GDP-L-galactose phosphorylase 1-like isoform X4 [Iris pallida]|uniref:GDP-L-galactose phosphorylase 1-like isoform X4 n=1 Tax=Iris pallida TaxID=29817 RepID=A0AAX6GUN7_IRIPA|nr:GDP-L-galactose phosphorylase 1-like isoform X4 [Iris pallida]
MVSVKQLECEYPRVKSNTTEQCKCHQMPPIGIKAHLYQFGTAAIGSGSCYGFSSSREEGQSLLDAFLLSQWEDRSWKGQLAYDVTMCETKIVSGGTRLIAQLNEQWSSNVLTEFENNALQPLCPFKQSYIKTLRENLLFCVATGEKECSELVPSVILPKDGTFILINVNPVEYGHVFLVPYDTHQRPFLGKRMLQLVAQIAAEVNNCSFRISYEHNISRHSDHTYFQAAYFANTFPVESLPTVNVYTGGVNKGLSVCEIADYPLKALLFMSKNMGVLVGVVTEICLTLQKDEDTVFSLLVSDSGTKIFLFPQAHRPVSGSRHLSAWECGGYFMYNRKSEFDGASEMELSKRMESASLGNEDFEALKQLCCSIAMKASPF